MDEEPSAIVPAPTPEEKRLRGWTRFWGLTFVAETIIYLTFVFDGPTDSRSFAINSAAKDIVWAAIAMLVVANVRRYGRLVYLLVLGHVSIIVLLAVLLGTGTTEANFPTIPGFLDFLEDYRLALWLAGALIPTIMLAWLGVRASKSRYRLKYLSPIEFETVMALADASIDEPLIEPATVAERVDRYWAEFLTTNHTRLKVALWFVNLWPITNFRGTLASMDRDECRAYLERRLVPDLGRGRVFRPIRRMLQAALRFATQLIYAGYYGHPRTFAATGYQRFEDRDRARQAIEQNESKAGDLKTIPPGDVNGSTLSADVVIVGSGAGGAVVAHELVGRGLDVLIVERGKHVDPSKFSDDELHMYSELYSDGAIQMASDFNFQVVQGMCVGGSTVVNNGVCINLPQEMLDRWNDELGAGLPSSLASHFEEVRRLMRVQPLNGNGAVSQGAQRVVEGIHALHLDQPPNKFGPVEANIDGCFGCGNCNIGCPFGKKLSMLDHLLPLTQEAARKTGRGQLRVLSECQAIDVSHRRNGGGREATGVRCHLGRDKPRTIDVVARKAVVVAAGAIHSSRLLQDSGVARGRAGRGLCANIAAYMTGDFAEPVDSHAGLQITHVLEPPVEQGYAIETWFNPVMSQALLMPGWLGEHEQNMKRYRHMTCAGVVVGSRPGKSKVLGRRSPRRWLSGADYRLEPHDDEIARVVTGLRQAGEILFAARAERVLPPTFRYRPYDRKEQLAELEGIRDTLDLSVNTAHPQGGNAVSATKRKGVVDPALRVHDYSNLYVCDASVFPTGVTVNPQLTVMALAHYGATHPQGLGAVKP